MTCGFVALTKYYYITSLCMFILIDNKKLKYTSKILKPNFRLKNCYLIFLATIKAFLMHCKMGVDN